MATRILTPTAVLLFAGALAWIQTAGPLAAADPASLPFVSGERLVYRIDWNPPWYMFFMPAIEAGEATLRLAGEVPYKNRNALKIVFTARSTGTLVRIERGQSQVSIFLPASGFGTEERKAASMRVGGGRKPNPVSLQSRDGNHSSGSRITPGI